ncbi:MAG: hypothetical protein J6S21_04405 [Victivallales bacterium]|nr:hypothetical protein [Victivallales bacterium]
MSNVHYYSWGGDLDFTFNRPLAELVPATVRKYISIEPEITYSYSVYGTSFELSGTFPAGELCRVTLKKGFPGPDSPAQLSKDFTYAYMVPDKNPSLDFASHGVFMPMNAPVWELPFTAVNAGSTVHYSTRAVYPSNLQMLLADNNYYSARERYSYLVKSGRIKIENRLNVTSASGLNLEEAGIPKGKPGIYQLKIHGENSYPNDTRLITVTDLGLFAVRNGNDCLVVVRSLTNPAKPVPHTTIALYSAKYQLIGTGTTDDAGRVRISVPEFSDKEDYPALLIACQSSTGDTSYLELSANSSWHFLSPKAPVLFCFADRGICRPGEEIRITAVMREMQNGRTSDKGTPVEFLVKNPWGNTVSRITAVTDEFGVAECAVKLPGDSALGNYGVHLRQPGAPEQLPDYGETSFLVGDFMPDQIHAETQVSVKDGRQLQLEGKAGYYFGKAVTQAEVTLEAVVRADEFVPPRQWREYSFGCENPKEEFWKQRGKFATDEAGRFSWSSMLDFLDGESGRRIPAVPLQIAATATVKSGGGTRPVSSSTSATMHFVKEYLGVRKLEGGSADSVRFALCTVTPDGKAVQFTADGKNYKLESAGWHYVLKQNGDTYRREWEQLYQKVAEGELKLNSEGELSLTPPESGRYRLTISDRNTGRTLNAMEFWHGAGESFQRSPNPAHLEFQLDGEKFTPGDTARITFESAFDGTALVFTGTKGITGPVSIHRIKAGSNTIPVNIPLNTVQGSWFAGISTAGTVSTTADGKIQDAPFASGIAVIPVNQSSRRLDVVLTAPANARPGDRIKVEAALRDRTRRPTAGTVILWGVDEGILALTGYKTPDPFKFFFGSTEPTLEMDSIYPQLFPLLRVVNGKIGGGMKAYAPDRLAKAFQPERSLGKVPSGVIYLGTLRAGKDGKVAAEVQLPELAGRIRIMAVAVSDNAVGAAETPVTLSRPVVTSMLVPSFVAPGDTFIVSASVFNREVKECDLKELRWEVHGAGTIPESVPAARRIELGSELRSSCRIIIPPGADEGEITIAIRGTLGDTPFSSSAVTILRKAVPPVPEIRRTVLKPGEGVVMGISKAGESIQAVSLLENLNSHLQWLQAYPYACLEQVTAAAFPSLYTPLLAKQGLLPEHEMELARGRVNLALNIISARRTPSKWYAMWQADDAPWHGASIFAMLFQLEADNYGYPLNQQLREDFIALLRSYCNNRSYPVTERAVATYALAMADPKMGAAYVQLLPAPGEPESSPFVTFMSAMTMFRSGKAADGSRLLKDLSGNRITSIEDREDKDLDSAIRRAGIILWTLASQLPDSPLITEVASLLNDLEAAAEGGLSTHEHSWIAVALARLSIARPESISAQSKLEVIRDGAPAAASPFSLKEAVVLQERGTYTLANQGGSPILLNQILRSGNAEAVARGFEVTRTFLNSEGTPVTSCSAGDLITVRIHIKADAPVTNVVLTDLLPGGFEIEDESLLTRMFSGKGKLDAVKLTTRLVERRFDRLLWFGDVDAPHASLCYSIRAMTPGSSKVPPIQLESMYHPGLRAVALPENPVFTITE